MKLLLLLTVLCMGCKTPSDPACPPPPEENPVEAGYNAKQHDGKIAEGSEVLGEPTTVALEIHDNFADESRVSPKAKKVLGPWVDSIEYSDSGHSDDVPHGLWVMSRLIPPLDPLYTDVYLHDWMGQGDLDSLVQRIVERCETYPAVVVNNSWGMPAGIYDDATSKNIFNDYVAKIEKLLVKYPRLVVVYAAGNEGPKQAGYPQRMFRGSPVWVIGATSPSGETAEFTSWDSAVDATAHGEDVTVLDENGKWIKVNGTSFSCPDFASLAALYLSNNPEKTSADFVEWLVFEKDEKLNYPNPVVGMGDTTNLRQKYLPSKMKPNWYQRAILSLKKSEDVALPSPVFTGK